MDLTGANLHDVDLTGAEFGFTTVAGIDLSNVLGLDTIRHVAPSSVGVDTLLASDGRIPGVFLRGCGLGEWAVEAANLFRFDLRSDEFVDVQQKVFELRTHSPVQLSPLFISYSWGDAEFADRLAGALEERDIRYWRDKKDATAGPLDKVIDRGIRLNPTVLLVLSEESANSPWVEFELNRAVDLSRELKRHVLCPVALDDAWLSSDRISGQLVSQLKKYSVLSFEKWRDENIFDAQMTKLLGGLELYYRRDDET